MSPNPIPPYGSLWVCQPCASGRFEYTISPQLATLTGHSECAECGAKGLVAGELHLVDPKPADKE